MFKSYDELLKFVKEEEVELITYKLIDIHGNLKTISIPTERLNKKKLEEGYGFDGSNYGYAPVESSDMVFKGNVESAYLEPFTEFKTISMYADVFEVSSDEDKLFSQYPPNILKKAIETYKKLGIADKIWILPELEFYLFDGVEYSYFPDYVSYAIKSEAGNLGLSSNEVGYRMDNGYHAAQPYDYYFDFRNELMLLCEKLGIKTKYHHHEVGSPGQLELELEGDDAQLQARNVLEVKYLTKNLALNYGKTATFMPKPLMNYPGSGLHIHVKLLKKGKNLFYGGKNSPLGLSQVALYFIGGILFHAPSLLAFTNPSINSYKRLVPGYEAPIARTFGSGNRTSAIRIPSYAQSEEDKRLEFRPQDATCNPYFSFAAILMAGLDGIQNKIDPIKLGYGPFSGNVYENENILYLPTSLGEALESLSSDYKYLEVEDVFPHELIARWRELKNKEYLEYQNSTVTPWEFKKYYSC